MKTIDIVKIADGIEALFNSGLSINPQKFGYPMNVNLSRVGPIKDAFRKAQTALVEKYAARDEAGNMIAFGDNGGVKIDNPRDYLAAVEELGDQDVPAVDLIKVDIDHFPTDMPSNVFLALAGLVKEHAPVVPLRAVE